MLDVKQKGLVLAMWAERREKAGKHYDVVDQMIFNWPSISEEEKAEVFSAYQQRRKERMKGVSSPKRTPKHVIRCELGHRLYIEQFEDTSTAAQFLDLMLEDEPIRWVNKTELTAKGGILVIKCEELEGIIESEDYEGRMPDNYVNQIRAFLSGKWVNTVEDEEPAKKRSSAVEKKKRAVSDGDRVTIQQICADNKWEPRVARSKMRGAKWSLPDSGSWSWPKKEAPAVEKKLKELMK